MMTTRAIGGQAMGAARPLRGAARFAAYSAGQAACVAHVPEHDLGAAAYAIKAAAAAVAQHRSREVERDWQRQQIPDHLHTLVIEDQSRRNSICWSVFDDFILRLPLLLLPIPPRVRNQVAGALAIAFWFFLLLVPVAVSASPWWAEWIVIGAAALIMTGVVRVEGRRPIVRRPVRVR